MYCAVLVFLAPLLATATVNAGIDVRLDDIDGRSRVFVDLAIMAKWSAVRLDDAGWPASDARAVFFDLNTPSLGIDAKRSIPDYSGTYKLSFHGQATLGASGGRVVDQRHDPATNTTTAGIVVAPGTLSLALNFSQTRRMPDEETDTGITDVHLIRPGYGDGPVPIFTSAFLRALAPFGTLGFRAVLTDGSNDTEPLYPDTTEWSDRHVPADATQQQYGGRRKNGPAYEYMILLANMTGKDLWINIPISASDRYVTELARLFRGTLRPDLKLYVEYSQSVFNAALPGYRYVDQALRAATDDAQLNDPPATSRDELIHRWHARRLIELRRIFESVYGEAMHRSVRMLERWWYQNETENMRGYPVLDWVNRHYGPPSQFFYGISTYHMFYDMSSVPHAGVQQVVEAYRNAADDHFERNVRLVQERIAAPWQLKTLLYAAGPSIWMSSAAPVHAEAFRTDSMGEVFAHDLRDNWIARDGDVYMYWGLAGAVERLLENVENLDTPAYRALCALTRREAAPSIAAITGAAAVQPLRPGDFATVWGSGFTSNEIAWDVATPSWSKALPNALDGVVVRIGGKDCAISWVSPSQINLIVPADLEPGEHDVEIYTNGGAARTRADFKA